MELLSNASFAERFKELVGDTPYREVSTKLNIGISTISAYINGIRTPKVPVLRNIADVYQVDPLWLMGYDVPKYKEAPKPLRLEDLNPDQLALAQAIADLTPAEVQSVRAIVEQVKNLRGK